ncbi:hypothetical protein ADL21_02245 [Streptomyces albus subsp. albus]|nr:hypothetical protein ADL21_02245 [Streptomyces albus subsp. albus]
MAGPWDVQETHSVLVPADADTVWALLNRLSAQDVPMVRALFAVRAVPARLKGRRPRTVGGHGRVPLLEQLVTAGFTPLADEPPSVVTFGRIGTFWKLVPDYRIVNTSEEFAQFDTPGFVKAILTFELSPQPTGTRLSTTTMVRATDETARRAFHPYWRVIRRPGGMIRNAVLRTVAHQARTGVRAIPAREGPAPRKILAADGTEPETGP